MKSYHDGIQSAARAIEANRAVSYDRTGAPRFTLRETEYLLGAIYKLLRVLNDTVSDEKARDDVLDSYNYCALLYEQLLLRDYRQKVTPSTDAKPAANPDPYDVLG